jgi:hypothetical protein
MQTSNWGPSLWHYLHTVSFNYPIKDVPDSLKNNIYNLFDNLQYTLPCKYCRESYIIFFKYLDLKQFLQDRMGLTIWVYLLHNIVNKKLKKPTIPFISVINKYENIRAEKSNYNFEKFGINAEKKYKRIIKKLLRNLFNSPECLSSPPLNSMFS